MQEAKPSGDRVGLSFVIPVLNEEASLVQLADEIVRVCEANAYEYQVIFVDDGSSDSSWSVVQEIASRRDHVLGLKLRRNFGKAAALSAGIAHAVHDKIVTMDGDLQDDPAEVPKLLEKLGEPGAPESYDVVSGWKKVRLDPLNKRLPSKVFNYLVNKMTGVKLHDHNCGFKVYRSQVFDDINLYGELHRFVPVLAAAKGYRVAEIPVHHRARMHGHTKYGSSRIVKGFLDLLTVSFITSFNQRPQHLLGSIGLISFLAGFLGLIIMAGYWTLRMIWFPDWTPLHQRPVVIYSLGAFLLGAQMLTMGFLAELLVAKQAGQQTSYSVAETSGDEPDVASTVKFKRGANSEARYRG